MKKYFTKYLPVEGEIKPQDRAIDPWIAPKNGLTCIKDDTWLNDMGDEVVLPEWKTRFNFQKVKLFLCSRDIQVGDKVIHKLDKWESGTVSRINKHEIYIQELPDVFKNVSSNHHVGKVIGEISPEASWITERMEFDEEDILIHHDGGRFYAKFRCPSSPNHFH